MRGNLPVIRLLLEHDADPNMHDSGYHATPAGWAEHHGQHDARQLLDAVGRRDAPAPMAEPADGPMPTSRPGAAMRTVAAAFTAVSEGRLDGAPLDAPAETTYPERRFGSPSAE